VVEQSLTIRRDLFVIDLASKDLAILTAFLLGSIVFLLCEDDLVILVAASLYYAVIVDATLLMGWKFVTPVVYLMENVLL
jgi:hypothetical protein